MRNNLLLFVALILSASFTACRKGYKQPEPENKSIIGNWQFVKAVGGITGKVVVNATYKLTYTFNADSVFKQSKNDTLENSGRFYIRTDKSIFSGNTEPSISFSAPTTGVGFLYTIKSDTLVITENHVEPFAFTYVRLK